MTTKWPTVAAASIDGLDTSQAYLEVPIPEITPEQAAGARRAATRWASHTRAGHLALADVLAALDIQETP